ncbi:hypothetical protein, partial [Riemerella anatipestifer]|uniref:hypothetical protein n=1 Tax=Riemerella anatipestifer TaxID=34085 RepID=UPI0021F8B8AE
KQCYKKYSTQKTPSSNFLIDEGEDKNSISLIKTNLEKIKNLIVFYHNFSLTPALWDCTGEVYS